MKKWQKKIIIDVVMMLILIFGIGAIAYPFVGNTVMSYLDQRIIEKAQEKANREDQANLAASQKKMLEKNAKLALEGINAGGDPFAGKEEETDFSKNPDYLSDHTLGTISIPKIDVRLPIFDRTSDFFLERGASLLEGTSYPIGGKNTHSVISAHRGLSKAKFFTDLPELKKKDLFYIEIGGNTFAYKIKKVQVIKPEETEQLRIEEGKDLVTLLTCTPYMINSHRLLVTGERTDVPAKAKQELDALKKKQKWLLFLVVILGLLMLAGILYLFWRRIKKQIISHHRYNILIRVRDTQDYKLYYKKSNKPVLEEKKPIILRSDADSMLVKYNIRGGKYVLKGENQQYFLWIDKIKQANFSYKNK
ncbi:class C sortase [Enterococcus hulanensis]|uniref:class C sortase n=1 Tax=Enterococcus hulanensis TaxID=2559929 RepID=UPI00288E4311|nr:class C sortase [Enterococcus hulanensis]MDT2659328.1 class C sortase [Enterococcus hulanensis]